MKSIFTKILTFFVIAAIIFAGFWHYNHRDFAVYYAIANSKREETKSLPDTKILEITSLGHSLSYADFMWISMIQYIGNNLSGGNYADYSTLLLEKITDLSPKFHTAYEWILWMLPIPQNSNLSYSDEQKLSAEKNFFIAKRWISELCESEKFDFIKNLPLSEIAKMQENSEQKNFCKSGMLPYLIAFYNGQLAGNTRTAEEFYKVAAMHDDAPWASLILANIAGQPKDNPRAVAENFLIMAATAYDEEPFTCQQLSVNILGILKRGNITKSEILEIEKIEKNLQKFENASLGMQMCQTLAERGMKYTYLHFFAEQEKKFGNTDTIEDLLEKIGLDHIPNTRSQGDMTLVKKNGNWEFYPLQ